MSYSRLLGEIPSTERFRVLLLLGLLSSFVVRGGAAEAAEAAPPPMVRVVLVGQVGLESTLRSRIAGWFSSRTRLEVWREQEVPPLGADASTATPTVLVRVIPRTPESVRIYFTVVFEPKTERRFLIREVVLPSGMDEIGLERIAQVIHSASVALWEGREQSSRAEFERLVGQDAGSNGSLASAPTLLVATRSAASDGPSEAKPARADSTTRHWPMLFMAGYSAIAQGKEGLGHGPVAGIEWLFFDRWSLAVEADFWWRRSVTTERVTFDLSGGSILTMFGWRPRINERLLGEARAGVGVHCVTFNPREVGPDREPGPGQTEGRPVLHASLGLKLAFARAWNLGLALRLDTQLRNTYYYVENAGTQTTLVTPWRLQPGTLVSLNWNWGSR